MATKHPLSRDPLAQPTRARLYELLTELDRTATTDELARLLGLHPNGVRAHLGRLEQEGFVERARERHGPGRPRDVWTTTARDRAASGPARSYENLARWLAEAIEPRPARLREVEAAGFGIGRQIAEDARLEPGIAGLETALAAGGFRPTHRSRSRGHVELCLTNCPYADAVHVNQPVVCALHRGMTQGMVDVLTPEMRLAGFEPKDPDRAGCVIDLRPAATRSPGSSRR